MEWFTNLPNDCPPDDAQPQHFTAYYLLNSPISVEDFIPLAVRQPNQLWASAELECQASGLSIFENPIHADRVRKRVRRLRNHQLSVCSLMPEHGVSKPTSSQFGNSHRTWWPAENVKPWELFRLAEE